jgi:hypothetical protein
LPLGELEYDINVNDNNAKATIQSTSQAFKEMGGAGQSSAQQLNQVPQSFQTIVQEGNKVTTTTRQVQQTMQGTVTTVTRATNANKSWGSVLKENVLAIGNVASGVIGLISQYTQLRRMQVLLERQQNVEIVQRHTLERLIRSHADAVQKFGANSREALDLETKINDLQRKHQTTLDQLEIRQQTLNERMADFAVNILPNIIQISTGVIQVLQGFGKGQKAVTTTTIESTGAQIANAAAMKVTGASATSTIPPLNGVAAAELRAGTAAKVMGSSMRTALIRTGIGAIIVIIGTALVAFTQNWYGFRDAVNAAGKAIGDFLPFLRPLLDGLTFVGNLLGDGIPQSADAAEAGLDGVSGTMDDVTESGKTMNQILEQAKAKFRGLLEEMSGLDKKKDRINFAKDLGIKGSFGKNLARVIDNAITPGLKHLTAFGKLTTAFQGGIFDAFDLRKAGFLKKLADTWDSRFEEIANDLDLDKHLFDPITDVIRNGKGKTDAQIANEIAAVVVNTPAIAAAIAAYDPELLKMYQDMYKNNVDLAIKAAGTSAEVEGIGDDKLGLVTPAGKFPKLQEEKSNMEKILDEWKISASTRAKSIGEAVWKGLNDIWAVASTAVSPLVGWFDKNIWSPLNTFLGPAFDEAKKVADQVWLGLNNIWAVVVESPAGKWVNDNIITPLKGLLTDLYNAGKAAADQAWLGLNNIWAVIVESPAGKWVNDNIIKPLQDKNLLTNLYNAGKAAAWEVLRGITDILGPISNLLGPGLGDIVKLHDLMKGQEAHGAGPEEGGSRFANAPSAVHSLPKSFNNQGPAGFGGMNVGSDNGQTGGDSTIANQTALQKALQTTQTAFANLAIQGSNSMSILAKASSTQISGIINNLKVGEVGSQQLQTGIANLANQGSNSFSILAKASSTNMNGMIKNLKVGEVASQKLQTGIANLSNEGIKSLSALAKASSKQMNGFSNNMKVGVKAVNSLKSAISSLKSKTVTVSVKVSGGSKAKGGVIRMAEGGVISAARGFTTSGPQLLLVGDNPGGKETIAAIPHDAPSKAMNELNSKFGSGGSASGKIPATIIINIGTKQFIQQIELELGKSVRAYLP